MEKQFISEPMDFDYKEGNSVDFEKTFDLTGNDNDQMLRVYLRKAGLSDNIEYLSPEQRKAFIYDIVKSNKNPGYWKPSVLPQMPPTGSSQVKISAVNNNFSEPLQSIDDIPPASMTSDFNHYAKINNRTHSIHEERYMSVSNEHQKTTRGTLYERQFQLQDAAATTVYNTPPIPPSPTALVTRKGLQIEVSAPTNFQHVSGDMTRDMSKNAFDLSGQFNDNALKKYMIERGITEDDVKGMNTKELIRKIVQSKYTWMPIHPHSGSFIPPPPCETYVPPSPLPPPRNKHHSKGGALIVSSPMLPEVDARSNENIYLEITPQEQRELYSSTKRPTKPPPPAPSPIFNRSNPSGNNIPPPPPPPPPTVLQPAPEHLIAKAVPIPPPMSTLNKPYNVPPSSLSTSGTPPPPPPQSATMLKNGIPPPPPPPSTNMTTSGASPPPPPPQPTQVFPSNNSATKNPIENETDSRGALLESIRTGVSLKKVNNHKPSIAQVSSNSQTQVSTQPKTAKENTIKPPQPDFMSELRNATLKRIKKLENNPYAEGSETNC